MDSSAKTNLIINYLPQNVRDKELGALFSPIGPLKTARVAMDRNTNYRLGQDVSTSIWQHLN